MKFDLLDHGKLELLDVMGDDQAIVDAARMSYGAGTKSTRDHRGLIRYLMRHKHTSPFEMAELKFYAKMPVFVARQWIRHRTANVNEYSGRYSEMIEDFYIPDINHMGYQHATNPQASQGNLDFNTAEEVRAVIAGTAEDAFESYHWMLSDDISLARETSRIVLPLNTYTEVVWKLDLHNLLHFIRLRNHPKAQYEIRVYAEAMAEIVKAKFPLAYEAFEDYVINAMTFSSQELDLLSWALRSVASDWESDVTNSPLSRGERTEFLDKIKTLLNRAVA